jgi:hypothetical protein
MFFLTQLVMILFAYSFAHFQEPIIRMIRDYVPTPNPYNFKFHKYGAAVAAVLGLMGALNIMPDIKWSVINLFTNGLCYWLVFDLIIGFEVYDNLFYLGTTSKLDKLWKGNGKTKAFVLGVIILGINAVKILL